MVRAMIAMLAAATLFICLFQLVERWITWRRIKAHQKEWDAIRFNIIDRGGNRTDIDHAYMKYMDKLLRERSRWGACFPKEWSR